MRNYNCFFNRACVQIQAANTTQAQFRAAQKLGVPVQFIALIKVRRA